jgi:hypothetical protein
VALAAVAGCDQRGISSSVKIMFERYTEKARRVVFFARYEASHYGSPYIETEHLLLGMMREELPLLRMLLGQGDIAGKIRAEIEEQITRRERISASVEMPLTAECKKAFNLASEEAERLAHRHIGNEHVLLGLLRVEGSLAARLLQARGLKADAVREKIAKLPSAVSVVQRRHVGGKSTLDSFLAGLKSLKAEELIEFFAASSQFTDASGRSWNREEIFKNSETLFAHYAKKNSTAVGEYILADVSECFVASVVWKNAMLASEHRAWMHRMSVVLIRENEDWRIVLLHVTAVIL